MPRPTLEFILPVQNPGSVFNNTIQSIIAQSCNETTVLISDNYSHTGLDLLNAAEKGLFEAGIPVKRIKPPVELAHLQHLNWAHSQSEADWLKPLFAGDELAREYVEKVLNRIHSGTKADLVRCEFAWKTSSFSPTPASPTKASYLKPSDFLKYFPERGNWLGSTLNMCYRRTAFFGSGGYAVHFPAFAHYNLFIRLSLGNGIELLHELLDTPPGCNEIVSDRNPRRRVVGCIELWLILLMAKNYCRNKQLDWPDEGILRGVWKQIQMDHLDPFKASVYGK